MISHAEIIQLVIAYSLTGAFLFTFVITCLSLLGWLKFADLKQQKKLFYILVVELVTICMGSFSGFLNLHPGETQKVIVSHTTEKVAKIATIVDQMAEPQFALVKELATKQRKVLEENYDQIYHSVERRYMEKEEKDLSDLSTENDRLNIAAIVIGVWQKLNKEIDNKEAELNNQIKENSNRIMDLLVSEVSGETRVNSAKIEALKLSKKDISSQIEPISGALTKILESL